ncbi:MAG: hypothetical protein U9Q27_02450, partial [Patescibacteria group bacterium]|nr:hypothetical protein [Patescibacteria group bacterium]
MKKQTLFDLTSMPKMVLIITLIVMLGLLFGAISYLLKTPKIDLPIVTPAFETQCRIDSDCELIYTDYTNHSPCIPCDTSHDYFKCFTQEEIEKMGRRKISDVAVACKPCQNQQHICKCKNGKCEKVKIEAVEEVGITTDKMEYEIGETVEITIKSNTNKEIAICDPFYVIEKFDNGKWIEIKKILCPCGFRCTLVPYFILQLHKPREYNWDQTETWCDDSKKISEMISNQVPTGEYRVKSLLSDAKSAKICLVNSKTIYSNEFTIKEKSALDARCGEKVRFSENCGIAVIGFEFDSGKGKCVKKTGSCKVKTPFNTLEECQEV